MMLTSQLPPLNLGVREALAIAIVKRRRESQASQRSTQLESDLKKLKTETLLLSGVVKQHLQTPKQPLPRKGGRAATQQHQGTSGSDAFLQGLIRALQTTPVGEADTAAISPDGVAQLEHSLLPFLPPPPSHSTPAACPHQDPALQHRVQALQRLLRGVQLVQLTAAQPASALDLWCQRPPHLALTAFLQDTLARMAPSELRQAHIRHTCEVLAAVLHSGLLLAPAAAAAGGPSPPLLDPVSAHAHLQQLALWLLARCAPDPGAAAAIGDRSPTDQPTAAADAAVDEESEGGFPGDPAGGALDVLQECLAIPLLGQHVLAACATRLLAATQVLAAAAPDACDGSSKATQLQQASRSMTAAAALFDIQEACTASVRRWCQPTPNAAATADGTGGNDDGDFIESATARLLQAYALLPGLRRTFPLFCSALTEALGDLGGALQLVAAAPDGPCPPPGMRDSCRRACRALKQALMPQQT